MIKGEKLDIIKTSKSDIRQIIEFEKANLDFVCDYSFEKHNSLLSDQDCLHLSIFSKYPSQIVGHIILFGIKNPNKSLELKRITIQKKGQGFGREAIRLLKYYCFKKLKFHRLWLDVYEDNHRAIKLYESEGFTLEGTLRENIFSDNRYRSLRVYAILENEYNN